MWVTLSSSWLPSFTKLKFSSNDKYISIIVTKQLIIINEFAINLIIKQLIEALIKRPKI